MIGLLIVIQIAWLGVLLNTKFKYSDTFKWYKTIRYYHDFTRIGIALLYTSLALLHIAILPTTVVWYIIYRAIPKLLFKQVKS